MTKEPTGKDFQDDKAYKAYQLASDEIERAIVLSKTHLDLVFSEKNIYLHLDRIPRDANRLTNLKHLHLNYTKVADLSPISALINLECLALNNTQVHDLTPIANLIHLEDLDLSNTHIIDLQPIHQLTKIEYLCLNHTQVCTLEPINQFKNLVSLELQNTQIFDLAPICACQSLTSLNISGTEVHDLDDILKLKKLIHFEFKLCRATMTNPKLAEISRIKDAKRKMYALRDYLEST